MFDDEGNPFEAEELFYSNFKGLSDDQKEKVQDLFSRFCSRIDQFKGGSEITDIFFESKCIKIYLSSRYRHCQSCPYEFSSRDLSIPHEIFFSETDASDWIHEREQEEQKKEQLKQEQELAAKRKKAAEEQEKAEQATYQRLKEKYEKPNQ